MKTKLFCVAMCILAFAAVTFGQVQSGAISGTVTDPSDASVGGATIEIRNTGTNAVFRTQSNDSGFYTAPGLPVGEYEVVAQMQGFKRSVRSGITLQVNQNAQVNIRLEVGQLAESVEVTGEAPLVNTGNATLGAVIENRRVRDLPLNGRNALALTLLNPGVISNAGPTNSGFGDRGIQISSLSINGSPNSMNNQTLDGNNNVLSYVGEVGVPPAVDAVEEFKVQSGAMSAEFGFTAGGTINLVTKSGTNELHGTAYEFLRNDKFDARNTFAARRLPLRYNQFGASVGGAAIKNRTFGFFNWEEYRLRVATPRIASVPIDEFRTGNFARLANANGTPIPIYDPVTTRANPAGQGQVRDLFPGNVIPASRFDPVTRKILDFWPAPNRTPINAFTFSQNFEDQAKNTTNWTQYNWRVDHRVNDKNSMFFRYTQARHYTLGNTIFTDPTVGQARDVLRHAHLLAYPDQQSAGGRDAADFHLPGGERRKGLAAQAGAAGDRAGGPVPADRFRLRHHRWPGLWHARIPELGHSESADEDPGQPHAEVRLQPPHPVWRQSPGRGAVGRFLVCRTDQQSAVARRHGQQHGAVPVGRSVELVHRPYSRQLLSRAGDQHLCPGRLEGESAVDLESRPAVGLAAETLRTSQRPHQLRSSRQSCGKPVSRDHGVCRGERPATLVHAGGLQRLRSAVRLRL
jgi:hypothetical protein